MVIECDRFKECKAPVCPEQKNVMGWYPNEDICTNKKYSKALIIKNQRRIKRIAKGKDVGYFTVSMLNVSCVIGKGMTGIDPDKNEEPQLITWLRKHPAIIREAKEKARERGKVLASGRGLERLSYIMVYPEQRTHP